jgi:TrmH family RNA methyltransferase
MLTRAESRLIHALKRRKGRAEHSLFLAEGVRVAEEALRAGIALEFAVVSPSLEDSERGRKLGAMLEQACSTRRVSDSQLAETAATETPQGVVLVAAIPRAPADPRSHGTVLVLDAIQDPGNFGTLVRTADALGASAVLALSGTVDPWNPKAVRAAAGSSFHVPILQQDPLAALTWLEAHGVTRYVADAKGEAIETVHLVQPNALIVGNEGAGVGETMLRGAHASLAIRIRGRAESLNVGVAAGILLYLMTGGATNAA